MASDDEAVLLTYDEAVALLPDGDEIHTFVNPAVNMLVGTDWGREQVLDLLRTTDRREVTGEQAQAMHHGLAAFRDGYPVFIETRQAGAAP